LQAAGSLREAIHDCVPLELQSKVFAKVSAILRTGGKGVFGNAIEAGHFYYLPNSSAEPDLEWAELKCAGLPESTIPCVVEETAETSHAFKKLLSILLVFYDYAKVENPDEFLDLPIRLVGTWVPTTSDVALFKRDWELIQGYVKTGKAHELSEGLTPLLGACTKSTDSKRTVKQRVGAAEAKPRAFALKQAFVTEIFRSLHAAQVEEMVKESVIAARHSRRIRKLLDAISMQLKGLPIEALDAFRKSGLRICVCRIEKNDQAAEAVSFPAFEYAEVADETEWEDSSLYQDLVKRFLFVFLRDDQDGTCPRFDMAVFWSMPEKDLDITQSVWADAVRLIRENRLEELPAEASTYAVHIRPHDRKGLPGFKRSYWLNRKYVTKIWSEGA